MPAYLINLTIIWALSLLLYELLFKHQTFHKLNRIYLLFTLVMGIALPLIHAPAQPSKNITTQLQYPLYQLATAKQHYIQASTIKAANASAWNLSSFNLVEWIYLAGCCIALLFLFKELFIIHRYYKNGIKQQTGKWTIIETNQSHGPFSLLHYIFVSNRKDYSDAEWQIVLTHEKAHGEYLHFLDLAILQLLRICCWFHPLVYVYRKHLLLLHEYQADQRSAPEPITYGRFLIAQSMLQQAPSFTHSLNRKPLKQRITMLTRSNSSNAHALKLALIIPLIAVCFVCCTKQNAQKPLSTKSKNDDSVIQLAHDQLTFHIVKVDSFYMYDRNGGRVGLPIHMEPIPYKLNGEILQSIGDVSENPQYIGPDKDLTHYLLNNLRGELKELPDGKYTVTLMGGILNKEGKMVYNYGMHIEPYEHSKRFEMKTPDALYTEFFRHSKISDGKQYKIDEATNQRINQKVRALTDYQQLFTAAQKNGQTVPYQLISNDAYVNLYIKNGTIQY